MKRHRRRNESAYRKAGLKSVRHRRAVARGKRRGRVAGYVYHGSKGRYR